MPYYLYHVDVEIHVEEGTEEEADIAFCEKLRMELMEQKKFIRDYVEVEDLGEKEA